MKKVGLFLVSLFALIFTACNFDLDEIIRESELEYITVDTSGAEQMSYLIGESFNPNGIKVIGHYTDNSSHEEDIRLVEFLGFSSENPNEKLPITVKFNDITTSYNVIIEEAKVVSIFIYQYPSKLIYARTDTEFDAEGLIVMAEYSNGTKRRLIKDEDYLITGYNNSKLGDQEITIVYINDITITTTLPISVNDCNIIDFSIVPPNRKYYMLQEHIDTTGLIVNAVYDSNIGVKTIEKGFSLVPPDIDELGLGEHEIKVVVNGMEKSFTIEIVSAYVRGAVIKGDFQPLFYEGEKLNLLENYSFYKDFSNGTSDEPIKMNTMDKDVNSESYSYLKYSYNRDLTDEEFDSALELDNVITFSGTGLQSIYFYYKYYDRVSRGLKLQRIEKKISVADSPLDHLNAVWNCEGKTGYPLGVAPTSNETYGTWKVYGVLENGRADIEIPVEYCNFSYTETKDFQKIQIYENTEDYCYYAKVKCEYFDVRKNRLYSTLDGDNLRVKVIRHSLVSVILNSLPETNYTVDQKLNLNNLHVTLIYSDGDEETSDYTQLKQDNKITLSIGDEVPLQKNNTSVTITFRSGDSHIDYELPISVKDKNLTSITITQRNVGGSLVYRKGKNYDSEYFLKDFIIHPKYDNNVAGNDEINDVKSLSFNLKTDESNRTSLYVVYKIGDQSFSAVYSYSNENNHTNITLLPALPVDIDVTPAIGIYEYKNLNDVITNNGTKYNITFEDGSIVSNIQASDKKINREEGSYQISTSDNQYVEINFTPKQNANRENNNVSIYKKCLIRGIDLRKKTSVSDELYFAHGHNYSFNNYFDIYVLYTNDEEQIVSQGITFNTSYNTNTIHTNSAKNGVPGKIFATYKNENKSYTDDIDVYFFPPMPKTLSIDSITQNTDINQLNNNITYIITYEDDYKEVKGINTQDYCPINQTINNNSGIKTQITYKTNYNCSNVFDVKNINGEVNIVYDKLDVNYNKDPNEIIRLHINNNNNNKLKDLFTVKRNYKIQDKYSLYENIGNYNLSVSKYDNSADDSKKCDGYISISDDKKTFNFGNKCHPNENTIILYPSVTQITYKSKTYINLYYGIQKREQADIEKDLEEFPIQLIINSKPKDIIIKDCGDYGVRRTISKNGNTYEYIYEYKPFDPVEEELKFSDGSSSEICTCSFNFIPSETYSVLGFYDPNRSGYNTKVNLIYTLDDYKNSISSGVLVRFSNDLYYYTENKNYEVVKFNEANYEFSNINKYTNTLDVYFKGDSITPFEANKFFSIIYNDNYQWEEYIDTHLRIN